MSYSMGSIDCLAVVINEKYKTALIEDIKKGVDTGYKLDYMDEDDLESMEDLMFSNCDIRRYDSGKYSENYAYARKLDVETGFLKEGYNFDGYVIEFSWGASSIYEPEFKNKEELFEKIKRYVYIPTNFDLENNIIFLTGVWGG